MSDQNSRARYSARIQRNGHAPNSALLKSVNTGEAPSYGELGSADYSSWSFGPQSRATIFKW
jgi:hypothetical protein